MVTALVSTFALILSLAASALSWSLYRATRAARATAPGEMLVRMAELEQEWADTLDSNTRFLKRVAERDRREAKKAAKDASGDTNGDGEGIGTTREQWRATARARGLIR